MLEQAKLKAYKVEDGRTDLIVSIPKDIEYLIKEKAIKDAEIRFDDGRTISIEQRKKAYATINDIAAYLGYLPEECKELMKYQHIEWTGCDYFSLSDCSMDTAREFINTLMKFSLEHDVPLSDLGTSRTDDIGKYLYYCIKTKHCAVCGAPGSDIHHCEGSRIGMGNDRNKVDDDSREVLCLCRNHHTILHTMPEHIFFEQHHIYGIRVKEIEDEVYNTTSTKNEEEQPKNSNNQE